MIETSRRAVNAKSIVALFSGEDGDDQAKEHLGSEGLLDELSRHGGGGERIPPDYRDLARLHAVVRARRVFTVLEFGVGYSTIVMADALIKNRQEWESLSIKPDIRNSNPFSLHAVDTSTDWIERAKAMIPPRLEDAITFHHSTVCAGVFHDRACHYYEKLPNVVPDFIYLDGPDPADVTGTVSGLCWSCRDRVVTSGDILRMEPQLLPGTFIVIDGRTANARFISSHLYRSWDVERNDAGDVTALELREPPLGRINAEALAYCLGSEETPSEQNQD